jgi:hypothetical protein
LPVGAAVVFRAATTSNALRLCEVTFTREKGKVVGMRKLVVSNNGKMTAETWTVINAKGQTSHNVAIFDKQ